MSRILKETLFIYYRMKLMRQLKIIFENTKKDDDCFYLKYKKYGGCSWKIYTMKKGIIINIELM